MYTIVKITGSQTRLLGCKYWFYPRNGLIVSPLIHMLKHNPQCDGTCRSGLWKVIESSGWSHYEQDECPNEGDIRQLSCLTPVRWQQKHGHLWTRKQAFTRHHISWHLDSWAWQPLEVWESNFCRGPQSTVFCYRSPKGLRQPLTSGVNLGKWLLFFEPQLSRAAVKFKQDNAGKAD